MGAGLTSVLPRLSSHIRQHRRGVPSARPADSNILYIIPGSFWNCCSGPAWWDLLTAYEISKRPKDKNDERAWTQHDLVLIRILDLNCFFGDKTVGKLKAQLCRDFVDWSTGTPNENNRQAGITPRQGKVSDQTARHRLEDLRAAVRGELGSLPLAAASSPNWAVLPRPSRGPLKIPRSNPHQPSLAVTRACMTLTATARMQNRVLRAPYCSDRAYFVAHFVARKNHRNYKYLKEWSEWQDSNLRPLRPERSALPG